jgi:hypothetical protein
MTTEAAEQGELTARYRVTPAIARQALWLAGREWVPVLVGLALLTLLCALWSPLGQAGRLAAIVVPVVVGLRALSLMNRAAKSVEAYRDRDFVLRFGPQGLALDSGLMQAQMAWTTVRQIVRGRSVWLFHTRTGSRFYVPADAIPVEARALVARWASVAGARLG